MDPGRLASAGSTTSNICPSASQADPSSRASRAEEPSRVLDITPTELRGDSDVNTVQTGRAGRLPPSRLLGAALMILAGLLAGCGHPGGARITPSPSSSPTPTTTPTLASSGPCGTTSTPPRQYLHVIWIIME